MLGIGPFSFFFIVYFGSIAKVWHGGANIFMAFLYVTIIFAAVYFCFYWFLVMLWNMIA